MNCKAKKRRAYRAYRHPLIQCPQGACLAAQTGEDEFLFLGCGCYVEPVSLEESRPYVEFLSLEEGETRDGAWNRLRMLNGDEERICFNEPTLLRVRLRLFG